MTTQQTQTKTKTAKPATHIRFADEMQRLADRLGEPDESKTGFRRKIGWKLPYWIKHEQDPDIRGELERAYKLLAEAAAKCAEIGDILGDLPEDYSDRRPSGSSKAEIEKGSTVRMKTDKVDKYVGLLFSVDGDALTAKEITEIAWEVLAVRKSKVSVRDPNTGAQFLPSKADFELIEDDDGDDDAGDDDAGDDD